jgi:predicted phosphodiesterase
LFEDIVVHEGLVMRYTASGPAVGKTILLTHGHQVDPINSRWWRLSRFFVRYLWKNLQLLGIRDPTSPANSFKKRDIIEEWVTEWIAANCQPIIVGHTHRARFPDEGGPPYFNTGSCVHPRCITGIEIEKGEITLIKWSIRPNESGMLYVARDVLAGPKSLRPFLLWRPQPGAPYPRAMAL